MAKCRGCGDDTRDYESPGLGWMHWRCEVERLAGLYDESRHEVERLRASRGRCDQHKDEPGPSLGHDCCEVDRLRGWFASARRPREQVEVEVEPLYTEVDRLRAALRNGYMEEKR